MTRSRLLIGWALAGVPAVLFAFIVWANATVERGTPPFLGWRWPFLWTLFSVLLLTGAIAIGAAGRTAPRFVISFVTYSIAMGAFLYIGGAVVSVMCGDLG